MRPTRRRKEQRGSRMKVIMTRMKVSIRIRRKV